jgi:4-amino-4-deoxy-L-arabinose transferase-like glycosyltransferase
VGSLLRRFALRHRYALGVAALVLLTAPLGVSRRPLWVGDETREAAIAKQMADSGDFLQARLAGHAMAEKPPFFYASVASSIRLRHGATRSSTRLPSVLFSALTLLAAAATASLLFSQRAGLLTAAVLATTYLFAVNGHNVVVDVALTAFVSLGLLAFVAASRRAGFPRWDLSFGLAASGAMLSKGLIGLALLALLTFPFWLFSSPRKRLRDSVGPGAVLAPLAALLFWAGVTYIRGGVPELSEAMWNQQFGRLLGLRRREYSHHRAPFYFYLASLPGMLFPWVVTLPSAVARGVRERARRTSLAGALPFAAGLAAAFLFLSLAGTKRTIYFLPVVPVVAMLVGAFLDSKLSERAGRVSRVLWLQFAAVGIAAVAVPLLPAVADRVVTGREAAAIAAVALFCVGLAGYCRRSVPRLVGVSLLLAIAALVTLDRYSLPRWKRDRATVNFFTRVERHLTPSSRLYTYLLNEDVLGWACLRLPRTPIAVSDPALLERDLRQPGAFLLAETATLARMPASWTSSLEPVVRGWAGSRSVSFARIRVPGGSPLQPASAAVEPALTKSSTDETKSFAHAVREEKPAHQQRQDHRADHGRDLRSRRLADPEGFLGNDVALYENAFDDEVQDQGDGQAEQNFFPLSGEANRVVDAPSEKEAKGGPDHAVDERRAQVAESEGKELHAGRPCGEEDDGPQAVEVTGKNDQAVAVLVKGRLDLPDLLGSEDLLQESAAFQVFAEETPKAVEDQVRDQDARELHSDHERKPRHALEHKKPRD